MPDPDSASPNAPTLEPLTDGSRELPADLPDRPTSPPVAVWFLGALLPTPEVGVGDGGAVAAARAAAAAPWAPSFERLLMPAAPWPRWLIDPAEPLELPE